MYQVRRSSAVKYEDLLRELENIEQRIMSQDSGLAMELMVLEAKIRERFQRVGQQYLDPLPATVTADLTADDLSLDDIESLIPRDFNDFSGAGRLARRRKRKERLETIGMAAVLAMVTALGVFGLASLLQIALSWLL